MNELQNDRRLAVGVDVGGTKIATALVGSQGQIVDSERQPTGSDKSPAHVIMLEGSEMPASELGHVPLVFDGRDCSCRHRGCLEAYVGGWAIAERARECVEHEPDAGEAIHSLAGTVDQITAQHVSKAFQNNDPLARHLVEETGRYLAAAAVGMVNTFNPSLLVFGGGVIEGLPEIADKVERTVRNHAFAAFMQDFQVRRAALGGDAGVIGAAALALAKIDSQRGWSWKGRTNRRPSRPGST